VRKVEADGIFVKIIIFQLPDLGNLRGLKVPADKLLKAVLLKNVLIVVLQLLGEWFQAKVKVNRFLDLIDHIINVVVWPHPHRFQIVIVLVTP
jgi:hypothetical protein